MRQRAAESDIVIVNHHLLCADASVRQNAYGEVIPECHVAVIDEAHQLEDVATQYFGMTVSTYRVEDLVRDVERVRGQRRVRGRPGRDAPRERPGPRPGGVVLPGAARQPASAGGRRAAYAARPRRPSASA